MAGLTKKRKDKAFRRIFRQAASAGVRSGASKAEELRTDCWKENDYTLPDQLDYL